jgi:LCP family protein required for cell wall assembly
MVDKKFNFLNKIRMLKRPTNGQFIWMGVGLVIAVALFIFLRSFVACWRLTALAGIPPSTCAGQATVPVMNPAGTPVADATSIYAGQATVPVMNPAGTPVADATSIPTISAPQVELPPPWDGASRVTILIIGLDYGDWSTDRNGPSRSDTLMLLTIDPVSKTAGMLSVPRDMWVNIPGFGYSKINNAFYFGELYSLPGGGPGLAMKTLENFLGIDIQYFVQVEFTTFEKMVDTIRGVCLTIPEKITVGRTYEHQVTLEPGYQCLDGKSTLGYARARYTEGGDVDRAGRQQQVIFAIRDKVVDPANFLLLISKAPLLYNELSGGIKTYLTLNDDLRLAMLAKDIPLENIQKGVIDYNMMQDGFYNLNGQQLAILRPYPDKIRELVDKIFGSGSMQPMASGTVEEKMQAEAARVVVINGSGVAGMAARTFDYLKMQGMNVTGFGNTGDYPDKYYSPFPDRTILIVHAGKLYAMQYLMALMQFNRTSQIIVDFKPDAPEDIVVALGYDWGSTNPMP